MVISCRTGISFSRLNKEDTTVLHLDETILLGVTGILYTVTDVDGGRADEQERFLEALART